jgi:hypothetical protein
MKTRKPRPKVTGELVGVRLQADILGSIDRYRAEESDLPTRPETIRRLIELGLKAKRLRK